eukprot:2294693-Pleurochrysis_carterae.AAC.2
MERYDNGKARVLILSDSLSGLRAIERAWMEQRKTHRKIKQWGSIGGKYERERDFRNGNLYVGTITRRDIPERGSGQHSSQRTNRSTGRDDNGTH